MIRRLTPRWRLHATAAAFVLPPLVYLAPLNRIARWIAQRPRPALPDATVDDEALADWVDRLLAKSPLPWRHTCLKRAVVLHYLLQRAGRPAELRIGVRRDEHAGLAAHAWLVRGGVACLESGASSVDSFQVLSAFPAAENLDG